MTLKELLAQLEQLGPEALDEPVFVTVWGDNGTEYHREYIVEAVQSQYGIELGYT